MEFTFKIYPIKKDWHACKLITTQTAVDLDNAIEEATKILNVFKKSAKIVFMIECDGKDIAGICPEVDEWVKL